tara:strand:- start:278 stop:412 length:135 start_codon:yes stop_codon:yes gene_type:complete
MPISDRIKSLKNGPDIKAIGNNKNSSEKNLSSKFSFLFSISSNK